MKKYAQVLQTWFKLDNRGRDALVAEVIFGWDWIEVTRGKKILVPPSNDQRIGMKAICDEEGRPHFLPRFSTDSKAAQQISERLDSEYGATVTFEKMSDFWKCWIDNELAVGESKEEALCISAIIYVLTKMAKAYYGDRK